MKFTYYGHSCFAVEVNGKTLLFDPFIRKNPLAKDKIDVDAIRADYILVTHGHYDHLDDAADIAKRTGARVVASYEVAGWLGKQLGKKGAEQTHAMNHGGAFAFDFGRVKYVNAIHSSSLPDGSYGGNPGGFVIESADGAEGNFYVSGDTALTMDMQLIGAATTLRFAALCVGDCLTMGIDDAIRAADFVKCDKIVGLHYDSFPPICIDHAEARRRFMAAGKELLLLEIGASHEF